MGTAKRAAALTVLCAVAATLVGGFLLGVYGLGGWPAVQGVALGAVAFICIMGGLIWACGVLDE